MQELIFSLSSCVNTALENIYLHLFEHTKSRVKTPGVHCAAAEELSIDIVPLAVLFGKSNTDPMFTVLIYSITMHLNRFVSFSPSTYSAGCGYK